MLSFWVSMILLMVALMMLIKTANSQPMKLKVSVKESQKSGDYTKDQETIRLAGARPEGEGGGVARDDCGRTVNCKVIQPCMR